jgi:signal transduction histidine kinase
VRRRLTVLVLAVTSLVVIAFTLPLGALIDRQADQRARALTEQHVQDAAAAIVREVATSEDDVTIAAIEGRLVLPDGVRMWEPGPDAPPIVAEAVRQSRAVSHYPSSGGWQVAIPVLTRSGVIVVTGDIDDAALRQGVIGAWLLLAALGLLVIGAALVLADRLGRSLTGPVSTLADTARRLGAGDLGARADVTGPEELAQIGDALNLLAPRLQELLTQERESVADISHRLRSPLTAARLQAESLASSEDRAAMIGHIDRLQAAVDRVIADARSDPARAAATVDLAALVRERGRFWSVLADEQGRSLVVDAPSEPVMVVGSASELGAAVDALAGNVFSHTDPGTSLVLRVNAAGPHLQVRDAGTGFPRGADVTERGWSGKGSTGLGLDIVRRAAERSGGRLRLGAAPEGGAQVDVWFGEPEGSA